MAKNLRPMRLMTGLTADDRLGTIDDEQKAMTSHLVGADRFVYD